MKRRNFFEEEQQKKKKKQEELKQLKLEEVRIDLYELIDTALEIDITEIEQRLHTSVEDALPALVRLSENERIKEFLIQPKLEKFWDKELQTIHESTLIPYKLHALQPQPGFHSLDLILGCYYYYPAFYFITIRPINIGGFIKPKRRNNGHVSSVCTLHSLLN